jgi:hypothetical protein
MSNKLCEIGNKYANPMPPVTAVAGIITTSANQLVLLEQLASLATLRVVYQWQRDP